MKKVAISVVLTLGLSPLLAPAVDFRSSKAQQDPTTELSKHWGEDATPNVRLDLKEADRKKGGGFTKVVYHLETSGFPAEKTYTVWMKQSVDQKIVPFISGYSTDASGKLVCPPESQPSASVTGDMPIPCAKLSMPLEQFPFSIGRYHKGEPLNLAVVSTDGAVKVFASAYPFPIQARDGNCSLTVELEDTSGNMFVIRGDGFEPGETVKTSSTWEPEAGSQHASPEGKFHAAIRPAMKGKGSGSATFTAVGNSCHPSVSFEWGKAAMKMQ